MENSVEQLIVNAYLSYGDEIPDLRAWAGLRNERMLFPATGMYDWIEAQILYLIVRLTKPQVVAEISPNFGYTTGIILLAMNLNRRGVLYSYDLERRYRDGSWRTFALIGIARERQRFIIGDVRKLPAGAVPDQPDLLFMDSDHSYEFARWYLSSLVPSVRRGGLIHVHDVLRYAVKPHQGDRGEGRALDEFLREGNVRGSDQFFTSEFVRRQPLLDSPLRDLERYPFGDGDPKGTNNIEQNASFWMIKRD